MEKHRHLQKAAGNYCSYGFLMTSFMHQLCSGDGQIPVYEMCSAVLESLFSPLKRCSAVPCTCEPLFPDGATQCPEGGGQNVLAVGQDRQDR